jgi:hypothetical protein
VWWSGGGLSFNGIWTLTDVKGNINSQIYINALENNLWLVIARYFADNEYVFQDDNAPVHRARITENYKQENNINCTMWPGQSPDLNVCENVWLCIKRALQPITGNINTQNELIFHGKVKNIAISSDPHSPFHCHACISYLSFTIYFSWSVIGVVRVSTAVQRQRNVGLWLGYFFLFSWPSIYVSYWFTKFSKTANFNFRESWFVFFFIFWDSWPETPSPLLLKFSYMEKVFKIDLNLQTFFSSIFICIF